MSSKRLVNILKWLIWSLAVSFYFYEFMLRVTPSVMVESLMQSFNINAEAVGAISSLYFYIYAPMQIPVGILIDRYGARKLLSLAVLICGLGSIFFGFAPNLWILGLARLMIGFGSAFAFVGLLYIISHWFPKQKVALLIGIANSISMIGAITGEGPISFVEDYLGWRGTSIGIGIIGILLSILMVVVVHNDPQSSPQQTKKAKTFKSALLGLKEVVSHFYSWLNAIVSALIYLATAGFGALWGVPFLQKAHNLSRTNAGFATSIIYVGWMVGGPILGHIADRWRKKRVLLFVSSILAAVSIGPIIYIEGISFEWLFILLFFLGFFSSSELLTFTYAMELHPPQITGSSIAFTNLIVMLGGALVQPFVGLILDMGSPGIIVNGVRQYTVANFQIALTIFPLAFLAAALLSLFLIDPKKQTVK